MSDSHPPEVITVKCLVYPLRRFLYLGCLSIYLSIYLSSIDLSIFSIFVSIFLKDTRKFILLLSF